MKKLLLCTFSLLLALPLFAQFESQTSQTTSISGVIGQSIVRDVNDQWAIGCINSAGACYFYAAENDGFDTPGAPSLSGGFYVQFIYNTTIMDVQYAEGRVFFCGTTSPIIYKNYAIYGWFELSDLTSGAAVNFTYYYFSDLDSLTRMAIVDASGTNPHIIAVGALGNLHAVVDIHHNINIEYALLPSVAGVPERIDDVLISDSKAIFVGTNGLLAAIGSPIVFYMRQAQATNLFASTLQARYIFNNSIGEAYQQFGTASTVMPEGRIAIVHKAKHDGVETRLATVQIADLLTCEHLTAISNTNRGLVYDAAYLQEFKTVISLHDDGFYVHHPYVSTPFNTAHLYPTDGKYCSMVQHAGASILSAGENRWLMQRFIPTTVNASCMNVQSATEQQVTNYSIGIETPAITVQSAPIGVWTLTHQASPWGQIPTCTH